MYIPGIGIPFVPLIGDDMIIEYDKGESAGVTTLMNVSGLDEALTESPIKDALFWGAGAYVGSRIVKLDSPGLIGLAVFGLKLALNAMKTI